jgi:steroid delta-isomerase
MTYESMMAFAESWIAAWNRRDVEALLAHYSETAQFLSHVASNLVGRPMLRDKKELEAYWRTALARISSLEFKLDHAAWDEKRRELNVVYEANLNGERKRACEIMCNLTPQDGRSEVRPSTGQLSEGSAMYQLLDRGR